MTGEDVTADEATRIVMSHRLLRRYVLPGERVMLATRRHWAKLAEPALTSLATLLGCAWLTFALEPTFGQNAYLVLWLWFATLARFGWLVLLWRVEWFVATNKRMLLLTGLITHQIAMMPLMKVTDMRYSRSLPGQMLGYGQFLLESAGQDQALRQLNWVSRPDATYRDLCALIFTPVEPPASDGEDDAGPSTTPPSVRPDLVPAPSVLAPSAPTPPAPAPSVPLPPVLAPRAPAPPVLVPGRALESDNGAPSKYGPEDTQPLRITSRAVAPRVEAESPPGADLDSPRSPRPTPDSPRDRDEPDERAWDVSDPTARFVDLRQERDRD